MAKEGCDKNCATCDIGNRAYCAVQLGLKNQELLMNMQTIISGLIQVLTPILTVRGAAFCCPGHENTPCPAQTCRSRCA